MVKKDFNYFFLKGNKYFFRSCKEMETIFYHYAENHVEENARISEEETVAAKGPTASEEDEWLYSQPRRFAKKPAHEQKD
jgi:hypothetical protein